MEKPMYLSDYLKYLDEDPKPTSTNKFKCGATRGQRPNFHSLLPAGVCFLYPKFLIFLTTSNSATGIHSVFTNAMNYAAADLALIRWANNPESILTDVVRSINGFLKPQELDKMLANPNSIFVPLNQLTAVKAERDWSQGNYIILDTHDGDIVLAEHISEYPNAIGDLLNGRKPSFMTPKFMFDKMKGHITGEWHSDVVNTLRAVARDNR